MNFDRYCVDKILNCLNDSISYIKWGSEISPDFWHGRFDLFGEYENQIYIIELECRREDPAANVIKVFRAIDENIQFLKNKKTYFIHIFSDFYNSLIEKRKDAEFTGVKMSRAFDNLKYISIDFDMLPPKRNSPYPSNTESEVKNLAMKIKKLIENYV